MSKEGGIVLSIIGGILSITVFGLLLLMLYPEILIFGRLFATIFQAVMIIGGVLTLIGAFISIVAKADDKKKLAWIIVIIGAILGGINIISIFGATQLKKESLGTLNETYDVNKIICPLCSYKNDINTRICRYYGKELIKGSNT
ncbi:MAG: hypothetical protein ACFFG0_10875 [Candidatus Thorarchaeota archaeon]